MQTYGLIGYPLSHSFSKKYFTEKYQEEGIADTIYELFPLADIRELPALLAAHPNLQGLNVTIPYKEAVLPYLTSIDEAAAEIGAVNTIKIIDGQLHGYNTDSYGFEISLKKYLQAGKKYKAYIFGTGGAAKAIQYVLHKLNITFTLVSRHKKEGSVQYTDLTKEGIAAHEILVNTTPLGMYPHVDAAPTIPYAGIGNEHVLYDLVYNPAISLFLQKGIKQGGLAKNGLEMLHLQAEKAWEIWTR